MAVNGYIHRAAVPRYRPHEPIAAFAIACMIGGFLTDIAYWQSAEFIWADFSAWLVSAAVVAAVVAILVASIDRLVFRSRWLVPPLPYLLAGIVVLVLAISTC